MKNKKCISIFLLLLVIIITSYKPDQPEVYNFNKKYSVLQLQSDFRQFRKILEEHHPRLYEYTSKASFDSFFDSLYTAINQEMTEREFQYFLAPVIGKIHCSHTKLLPSEYLMNHLDEYISAPPFKLYFDNDKAFFQSNFSNDTSIKPGAEILSVNGIKTGEVIGNFSSRIHNEGKNTTFIYNRMNAAIHGLFPGICDYPNPLFYTLSFINPRTKEIKTIKLKSINQNEYAVLNHEKSDRYYSFSLIDSLSTGIIKVASFNFNYDSVYVNFVSNSFKEMRSKQIQNLIIDIRGNIGGQPYPAIELLKNFSSKEFTYYSKKVGYEKLNNTVTPVKDYFKGNVYFLIDGGCRSTTGHFASLVKYHKLGTMIGEETCGSYSCNSSGSTYTLNNSKLTIDCPSAIFDVAVEGQTRGNGIMPDMYIKPTVEDIMKGKDAVLIYTLETIKKSK